MICRTNATGKGGVSSIEITNGVPIGQYDEYTDYDANYTNPVSVYRLKKGGGIPCNSQHVGGDTLYGVDSNTYAYRSFLFSADAILAALDAMGMGLLDDGQYQIQPILGTEPSYTYNANVASIVSSLEDILSFNVSNHALSLASSGTQFEMGSLKSHGTHLYVLWIYKKG